MSEDNDVLLIMGHPLLATGWSLIDMVARELITGVNYKQVVFNIFKAMKCHKSTDDYFLVNVIHGVVAEIQEKHHSSNPLEQALVLDDSSKDDEELADMVALLGS